MSLYIAGDCAMATKQKESKPSVALKQTVTKPTSNTSKKKT
jgi:hypothetical protein